MPKLFLAAFGLLIASWLAFMLHYVVTARSKPKPTPTFTAPPTPAPAPERPPNP